MHVRVARHGADGRQQHALLDARDNARPRGGAEDVSGKPVNHHELSAGLEQAPHVREEALLVRVVAAALGAPDGVERAVLAALQSEVRRELK